jgi:hypothetical protein
MAKGRRADCIVSDLIGPRLRRGYAKHREFNAIKALRDAASRAEIRHIQSKLTKDVAAAGG